MVFTIHKRKQTKWTLDVIHLYFWTIVNPKLSTGLTIGLLPTHCKKSSRPDPTRLLLWLSVVSWIFSEISNSTLPYFNYSSLLFALRNFYIPLFRSFPYQNCHFVRCRLTGRTTFPDPHFRSPVKVRYSVKYLSRTSTFSFRRVTS